MQGSKKPAFFIKVVAVVISLVLILLWDSHAADASSTFCADPSASILLEPLEEQFFESINAERIQAGLDVLQLDNILVSIASSRSMDMADNNYFSHYILDGELALSVLFEQCELLGWQIAGENIARNNYSDSQSAAVALLGFMASPAHRALILDERFSHVGIGVAFGTDNMKYFTVIFVGFQTLD